MRWLIIASLLAACHRAPAFAIVGDTTKLRRDEARPATSAIFDGHVVKLRGARGETLGLQVLGGKQVTLTIDGARVDAFAIHYLRVREPSTAMYGPSRGAGEYPDPLEPTAQPVRGDAFFDVVAADAGVHRGTLSVDGRAIPVEYTVEPLRIALVPFVWIWYRAGELGEDERAFVRLARAHGAYFASDLSRDDFERRLDFLDGARYWPVRLRDDHLREDADYWNRRFASLPQIPFATTVDEPRDAAARAEARRMGEAMGQHDKLLRVVTAPPSPDFGGAIDVFIGPASPAIAGTAQARNRARPHRWMYNGAPPTAGSMIIDTNGVALRTWGWIAERYGVELWYAWEGTYYRDRYNGGGPTDVLHDPLTFDQRRKGARDADWGNGDGVLVYPGAKGPWPSLRLKALRRGLEDRAILEALAACGAGDVVARETHALIPRALDEAAGAAAWPRDEAAWEAARNRLYDAWRARCEKR